MQKKIYLYTSLYFFLADSNDSFFFALRWSALAITLERFFNIYNILILH